MILKQHFAVGLIGQGLLYQAVAGQLLQKYQILPTTVAELTGSTTAYSLIIGIEDGWSPQTHELINRHSQQQHIPWLPVYCAFGRGIIGPCVLPGESGCVICAEVRSATAMKDAADFTRLRERFYNGGFQVRQPGLTAFSIEVLVSLVVEEVATLHRAPDRLRTRNALLILQLDTLQGRFHRFLPVPSCAVCGGLPQDTREAAQITLQSRQKLGPYTYRVRDLPLESASLLEKFADPRTGIVHALVKDPNNLYANVSAAIGLNNGQHTETGFGRALDYVTSQVAAIAEALERYGGMCPGGKRTVVRASYHQLEDEALDPTTLGLHADEQYKLPNFPYVPYHHDLICNWVWGYSFRQKRPILVPERCVYYGLHYRTSERPFVYEISNGCALGGCLEEAILHGILEVAERDAFLMTWYARLDIARIDPCTATDPTAGLLIERVEHMTGYTIHAFNATLEHGIPCFWVMAVDEQNRPDMPKTLSAAGSHLHPEKALVSAIHELAPMLGYLASRYQKEREHALEMLKKPYEVRRMDDHSLLYALPEAFERLDFLYHTAPRQTLREAFGDFYRSPTHCDLLVDLNNIIARYLATGLDVIVVDQTTPEHATAPFNCVKVLIPGMLPMTFGYASRRVTNIRRLYELPYTLGYRSQPLTDGEINPYPHPFP